MDFQSKVITLTAAGFALATMLSGCDGPTNADEPQTVTAPQPDDTSSPTTTPQTPAQTPAPAPADNIVNVAVTDVIETAGVKGDIAFWSHPTLAFNSLLLAAGSQNITGFGVESRLDVSSLEVGARAMDVAYIGEGVDARGYLVALSGSSLQLSEIQNATGALSPIASMESPTISALQEICLSAAGETIRGYGVGTNSMVRITITLEGGMRDISITPSAAPAGPIDCTVDPLSEAAYFLGADGTISRLDGDGNAMVPFSAPHPSGGRSLGLLLKSDDGQTPSPRLIVLGDDTSHLRLLDGSGDTLGQFKLSASFDYPAVENPSALGVGFGNYGGVYRDGAIALAHDDGISLVPWNAIATALELPIGDGVNPRLLQEPEEEGFVIDIAPIAP